jgi:hypothetical protein
MKFTKNQQKLSDLFFNLMSQRLNDIITIPAKNKRTGAETIVVCVAENIDSEEMKIIPFCSLFTITDNPWSDFELDLQQNIEIVPFENRRKRWWLLWLG